MSVFSLAKQCTDSLNFAYEHGLPEKEASICVVTPPKWKAPPKFPRRRVVRWLEDGSRVRYLSALNTLAWLAAHDMVSVAHSDRVSGSLELSRGADQATEGTNPSLQEGERG